MLVRLTLTEMARKVAAREISPRELVEAHLAQIEETNPRLNAFAAILAGQAVRQARTMEGQAPRGPLHGVPVTIKDHFDVEGVRTLCGSRARLEAPAATRDAAAVAHLRAAGAIILAKTNVPELVSSYETDNHVTGRTNHPLDPERTPGGSSGGEAAAIASFCSPGGLGSDGGGSIRIPAHFCGIVGFKPTHRAIGASGTWPPADPPAGLLTAPGPMARTVADVSLLFRAMAQPDLHDSQWVPIPESRPTRRRIGLLRQVGKTPVDPVIASALDQAAGRLADLGYAVEEFAPAGLERAPNVWAFFFGELSGNRRLLEGRETEAHWTATEFVRDTPWPAVPVILDHYAERERLRAAMLDQMAPFDAILSPPCSITGFRHRERRYDVAGKAIGQFAAMTPATAWNLFGFPALVMPFAGSSIQLAGHPFEDYAVLGIGEQLQ